MSIRTKPPRDHATAKATREFAIRDVMISHCGQNLTPDNVDRIAAELLAEIETGPCSWAFRINTGLIEAAPDLLALAEKVARLNPNVAEIGEGMLAHLHQMATDAITKATQQ